MEIPAEQFEQRPLREQVFSPDYWDPINTDPLDILESFKASDKMSFPKARNLAKTSLANAAPLIIGGEINGKAILRGSSFQISNLEPGTILLYEIEQLSRDIDNFTYKYLSDMQVNGRNFPTQLEYRLNLDARDLIHHASGIDQEAREKEAYCPGAVRLNNLVGNTFMHYSRYAWLGVVFPIKDGNLLYDFKFVPRALSHGKSSKPRNMTEHYTSLPKHGIVGVTRPLIYYDTKHSGNIRHGVKRVLGIEVIENNEWKDILAAKKDSGIIRALARVGLK